MCVCGFLYYEGAHGGHRHQISVELESLAVLNHSSWVLGTELESCKSSV